MERFKLVALNSEESLAAFTCFNASPVCVRLNSWQMNDYVGLALSSSAWLSLDDSGRLRLSDVKKGEMPLIIGFTQNRYLFT